MDGDARHGGSAAAVYVLTTVFPQTADGFQTGLAIPFLKDFTVNLGVFFIPFGCLVIVGASNAVNLTDGLDGLAIVPVMIACMSLAFIAYLVGNAIFSDYLGVPFVPGSAEITIFLGAIIGASLGFLWYNAPPAMVFMGDTGSLALGGALTHHRYSFLDHRNYPRFGRIIHPQAEIEHDKLPTAHWTAVKANNADVPIICDIEIFAREVAARPENQRPKIIAITGTNGKSTTTALINHVLSACGKDAEMGGNIGRGVLDLDKMHAGKHYVIELSSYQLERTQSLCANAAVFLNLSPDHLERHGDMDAYEAAKTRIFLGSRGRRESGRYREPRQALPKYHQSLSHWRGRA